MKASSTKIALLTAAFIFLLTITYAIKRASTIRKIEASTSGCAPQTETACVMKTIFGLEEKPIAGLNKKNLELPEAAEKAIKSGLSWIANAQLKDGGWGAGWHSRQQLTDPLAVPSDPATTALVSLSLLRTGNSLSSGTFSTQLKRATEFLLVSVENWADNQPRLTNLSGTQPQVKLGENIDAILTVHYFTNLLRHQANHEGNKRIEKALQKCVLRIQKEQDEDGGWKKGGWAPVLQSALADHALESAKEAGIVVDSTVLTKSKNYQKGNFDMATKSAITGKAAGVMLYSLSSTTRSSAKEANKARDIVTRAKKEGKLSNDKELNEATLVEAGVAPAEAKTLITAYKINESSKKEALKDDIMSGFGSNGGEEYISYLMTGESIVMQGGDEWKKWYDMMLQKLVAMQQNDGSWQGHHCITSPVFCTATCLLILSIQNDLQIQLPDTGF